MILILSQDAHEPTTEAVLDWIECLGGDAVRLNGEDLTGTEPFALQLDAGGSDAVFHAGGRAFRASEVRVVWLRRWHTFRQLDFSGRLDDSALERSLSRHLVREVAAATSALHEHLAHAAWLTRPEELGLQKMRALRLAAAAGLDVPATLVTNQREAVRAFRARHGRVVTKCVGDGDMFQVAGRAYGLYTSELADADLEALPEVFFPSLVQELLEKAYELRVWVLDGECHAMAIFSQAEARTALDFRRYDHDRPTRCVPYRLDDAAAGRIRRFMELAGLTTGSLDLVRTVDGRLVFLEVNPAGQFSMVSHPCNYRLEKQVAEHLLRRDADGAR